MYYAQELVEEVRRNNDIVDVITSYVRLQKKGSNYMGLCPFHNEKSPSFSVSASKQMYKCFGCGMGGNVFTFVMQYENYSFVEALRYLADRTGVKLPEEDDSDAARQAQDMKSRLLEINKEAAKYYFYQLKLKAGSSALEYLKNRGIKEETIVKFGLGYSNKYSDDLYQYLKSKGYTDELLKRSGLVTFNEAKGANDKFWNRVMYPIMDVNNKVIAFGGRVMGDGMPKYLNSPETEIFDKGRNLYGLNFARQSRENYMLLCEGYMDVIALYQAGFTNVVASLGTAFTPLQAKLLSRYTNEAVITYDADKAGVSAVIRAIPILKEAGINTRVLKLNPYKDPDEFIKALGAKEYEERIKQAVNSFFFEIEIAEGEYDLNDPQQKTRFYNEIARLLLRFSEELERNNYIEAVARKYNIGYENLRKLVNQMGARYSYPYSEGETREKDRKKRKPEDGMCRSQKMLLTWMATDQMLFSRLRGMISPNDFTEELYKKAAEMVFEQYEREQRVIPAKIINYFESKEEQNQVADVFSTELMVKMDDAARKKAILDTVKRVKKNSLDFAYQDAISKNNPEQMQRILKEQKDLENLHSSLLDG